MLSKYVAKHYPNLILWNVCNCLVPGIVDFQQIHSQCHRDTQKHNEVKGSQGMRGFTATNNLGVSYFMVRLYVFDTTLRFLPSQWRRQSQMHCMLNSKSVPCSNSSIVDRPKILHDLQLYPKSCIVQYLLLCMVFHYESLCNENAQNDAIATG